MNGHAPPPRFEALLLPRRSLSPRALKLLLGLICAASAA